MSLDSIYLIRPNQSLYIGTDATMHKYACTAFCLTGLHLM